MESERLLSEFCSDISFRLDFRSRMKRTQHEMSSLAKFPIAVHSLRLLLLHLLPLCLLPSLLSTIEMSLYQRIYASKHGIFYIICKMRLISNYVNHLKKCSRQRDIQLKHVRLKECAEEFCFSFSSLHFIFT